jgi:Lar family restriction alleviation protein
MFLSMADNKSLKPKSKRTTADVFAEAGIGRKCPFCGRREKETRDWHFLRITIAQTTQIECLSCGARGPTCVTAADNTDLVEAMRAWNKRHGDDKPSQKSERRTRQYAIKKTNPRR